MMIIIMTTLLGLGGRRIASTKRVVPERQSPWPIFCINENVGAAVTIVLGNGIDEVVVVVVEFVCLRIMGMLRQLPLLRLLLLLLLLLQVWTILMTRRTSVKNRRRRLL